MGKSTGVSRPSVAGVRGQKRGGGETHLQYDVMVKSLLLENNR